MKTMTSIAALAASRAAPSAAGRLRAFCKDQSGTMSYLAIVGSLVMMVFGGVGIDMMQAELRRTKVQNTLDRAVLAAANIKNASDPQTVVGDYFAAMGMADALTNVQVDQSMTAKRVTATGNSEIPSDFMSLIGVRTLDAYGLATAEHATANVEISMVLDVSGSMGWNNKIDNLRNAAKEFVDILMPPDGSALTTISMVPYNATVNMGSRLPEYFTLNRTHDYSACAVFSDAQFTQTWISPGMGLEQLGQFDPVSTSTTAGDTPYQWCRDGDNAAILPHSSDPAELKAQIDALQAFGNTAIDVGMKWGTALLDPASRSATQEMAYDGLVDAAYANRPAEFSDVETTKYVVIMTDGENTTQYDLPDSRKAATAMTGVWVNTKGTPSYSDDDYSVRLQRFSRDITNYFPAWPQAISNVVFYFDTNGDGIHDRAHKIEGFPETAPRDLDDFVTGAVGHIIANDSQLSSSAQFMGASIKGGNATTAYYAVKNNMNGSASDTGPTLNVGTIPGPTWQYPAVNYTAYDADSTTRMYYWTRTANDPANRYQPMVDGVGRPDTQVYQLSYNDLYDRFGTKAAASLLFTRPVNDGHIDTAIRNTIRTPYGTKAGPDQADTRLDAICDAAKAQGIVVFAIGFEAPQRGLDAMRNCASSPAHFFDVQGADLTETFAAIANTITQLRLTQ